MHKEPCFKVGCLLLPKDIDHLSIPFGESGEFIHNNFHFVRLDEKTLFERTDMDLIIHKCSDYLKSSRKGCKHSNKILNHFKGIRDIVLLDPFETVVGLADRSKMFSIMDNCIFEKDGIEVDVPRWKCIRSKDDLECIKNSKFKFPLICKAICAGEGPGCHAMQLIFNSEQLYSSVVIPCIAQEFINHDGVLSKVFVFGNKCFTSTRPSVRNFPLNGQPVHKIDSISFHSHDVAKLESKTFLNNYQRNFVLKNSDNGDKILNDSVVYETLRRIANQIDFNFLGLDFLVTDGGSKYQLVDINFLPSFSSVDFRFEKLLDILEDIRKQKKYVNYWK